MDLRGKKFILGNFEGEIEFYIAEKNSFLVKFNNVDLLEVDSATVINLLLQQESKVEVAASKPKELPVELQNSSSNSLNPPNIPGSQGMHFHRSHPHYIPFFPHSSSRSALPDMSLLHLQQQSPLSPMDFMTIPQVQHMLPVKQSWHPNFRPNLHASFTPGYQTFPSSFNMENSGYDYLPIVVNDHLRYQDGMRRHRSTSQPQPITERFVSETAIGRLRHSRRRDSLIDGRLAQSRMNQIHENVNEFPSERSELPEVTSSHRLISQPFPMRPAHSISSSMTRSMENNSTKVVNSSTKNSPQVSDATKAEIFKIIRSLYQSSAEPSPSSSSIPEYASIEMRLSSVSFINATRLSILRSRGLMKSALEPVLKFLPNPAEKYIVNALINICPLCGTSISLNKLGSHINWFKHLSSCHDKLGGVIANRFEFFETNADPVDFKLKEFDFSEEQLSSCFQFVEDRKDSAPIEQELGEISKKPDLIPFTTKCNLETLLLNNLVLEEIFTNESVLLQELLAFSLLTYKMASVEELKVLFPKLLSFQKQLHSVSEEGFKYYIESGHPDILLEPASSESDPIKTGISQQLLKERVLEYLMRDSKVAFNSLELDWRVLLFDKALSEKKLTNVSLLVQEILVLAFFYFGFITQRTPKKFRIFNKLLNFFGRFYKISCKCYDIYVGEGPTGLEHTRGKPVNPSKLIIQNYNHYGLSRKSLQRALSKLGEKEADGEEEEEEEGYQPISTIVEVPVLTSTTPTAKGKPRRGSVKRKNDEVVIESRRRRSSILNYAPELVLPDTPNTSTNNPPYTDGAPPTEQST